MTVRATALRALALAIACSACAPKPAARPDGRIATISLASRGGDECAARWNGEAVSQAAILHRSVDALERALGIGGGGRGGAITISEDNLPLIRIEAPAVMAYPCLGTTLRSLQRAGVTAVLLRPLGSGGEDARAALFFDDAPPQAPARARIAIGRDGLRWNGTPTDLRGIRANLHVMTHGLEDGRLGQGRAASGPSPLVSPTPPDSYVVTVAPETAFGALHALLRAMAAERQTATLRSCAGPAPARGDAIPGC